MGSFHYEKHDFQKNAKYRGNDGVKLLENASGPPANFICRRQPSPFEGEGRCVYRASSSFKMLFTRWGLALPFSSRMTCPTRKPNAFSLPPL